MPPLASVGFFLVWLHFEGKMGPNSPWNECKPSVNCNKNHILPHAMQKNCQEMKYELSSSLTNTSPNIPSPSISDPPGSRLSSLVAHEFDNQNKNTPCSSLNYQNPIPPSSFYQNHLINHRCSSLNCQNKCYCQNPIPPSTSYCNHLINQRNTISNSICYIKILNGLSNQNSIGSPPSCFTNSNYSSTSSHKMSDNGRNENKIYQGQNIDLDLKPYQLNGTELDESFATKTLSLPNMMMRREHVLQQYPESLSYNQLLFQPSQLRQQNVVGTVDASISCFGSAMMSTDCTDNAAAEPLQEMPAAICKTEDSCTTKSQVDNINIFSTKPAMDENRERMRER